MHLQRQTRSSCARVSNCVRSSDLTCELVCRGEGANGEAVRNAAPVRDATFWEKVRCMLQKHLRTRGGVACSGCSVLTAMLAAGGHHMWWLLLQSQTAAGRCRCKRG